MNARFYIMGAIALTSALIIYYSILSTTIPLIPREVLFGNPVKSSPRISPDGSKIAYIAPLNNVLNIWIKTIGKSDDYPLTNDKSRGIRKFFWSYSGDQIFYLQDKDGDENWLLYQINIATKTTRNLTPFQDVQINLISYIKQYPTTMLLGINKRDPKVHDVYQLDTDSGELQLISENPGNITAWLADTNLKIRAALESAPEGGYNLKIRDTESSPWSTVRSWSLEDQAGLDIISFTKDGNYLYICESLNSNTSRLVKFDTKSREIELLLEDAIYDIDSEILLNSDTYEIQAVAITRERKKWIIFDPELKEDFKRIQELDHGDFSIISRTTKQNLWTLYFEKDNGPVSYWLFDKTKKNGKFLFDNKPALKNYKLASINPVEFKSRDGLSIHGYITYPVNIIQKNLPLVLNVHGGPWTRDTWGYDPEAQWLTNRGYVVLQVNFRGSTGYGKDFLNAANKEWAGKMHDDLIDAVNWAIRQGTIDPKKIAIYGGSYGGYAALVGATFTPDIFCCAVDIVGPSNLITLLQTIPPYWSTELVTMYKRIGNPETESEFLKSRSPLFKVENIKIPLLIAQGANDPRVKQSESDQIVAAMKAKNIPYEYLLFPDEGHGFVKPANRLKFYAAAEKFLANHLGGRYEPENN